MNRARFNPTYWGKLKQFQVPKQIVSDGILSLKTPSLSVLLAILRSAQARKPPQIDTPVVFKMTTQNLSMRTGFSKDKITQAIKELTEQLYLQRVAVRSTKRTGRFASSEIALLDPRDGSELEWGRSRSLYFSAQIPYILFPQAIVSETYAPWSLAEMGPSQVRLYVAVCCRANLARKNNFTVPERELSKLVGLSRPTFVKALRIVQELGLMQLEEESEGLRISLCDPFTREPLHEKNANLNTRQHLDNYCFVNAAGSSKRMNFNTADPAIARQLLEDSLSPEAEMITQSSGDVTIVCPYHRDRNPSCSVSLTKQCFHCFGCSAKGTLRDLLMKLRKCSVEDIAKAEAAAQGLNVEFKDPDSAAEAKYNYVDANGKLVKQVQRFRDKETGEKRFVQWKPGRNGPVYKDVPTLLYNLFWLQFVSLVCITEGEKDADALTRLNLRTDTDGDVVSTTSGGANSWCDEFADHLIGKRVVILPDADSQGNAYANAIVESLKSRGIEHRRIDFMERGVKDVSDYFEAGYTTEQLVRKIGMDWLLLPGETREDRLRQSFVPEPI